MKVAGSYITINLVVCTRHNYLLSSRFMDLCATQWNCLISGMVDDGGTKNDNFGNQIIKQTEIKQAIRYYIVDILQIQ